MRPFGPQAVASILVATVALSAAVLAKPADSWLAAAASKPAKAPATSKPAAAIPANPPTSPPATSEEFLSDSVILARVEDRIIRVYDFRDRFYASLGDIRPANDSAGRETFLNRMVEKEVLGLTAREANPSLTFDDRAKLRDHTNTVLENTLYLRHVLDRVKVTEEDIQAVYPQFSYEQHLRAILFAQRATAEKVRTDLLRGRIGWRDAVRRYSKLNSGPDGDLGWIKRTRMRSEIALKAFALEPGTISPVIMDVEGFRLIQCVERKPATSPPPAIMRSLALEDLRSAGRAPLVEQMYRDIRALAHVEYDTTNILWAAARFKEAYDARNQSGSVDFSGIIPEFSPTDTSRVLVRTKERRITLGHFMYEFTSTPGMFRQQLVSLEPFIFALDGPALRQERIEYANAQGIDKDPEAVAMIERRREELMVEHVYQDSVMNRVTVTPEMRRRYYEQREREFVSTPVVKYARFLRPNLDQADALLARLKAGVKPEAIIEESAQHGDDTTGTIHEVLYTESAIEYRKVLFEELKPGQSTKDGPDQAGKYIVLHVIRHDPTRQMSFKEVEGIVDESLQNLEAERVLAELLARRRKHYRIESHPELLPRMNLTDPKFDVAVSEPAAKP